MILRPDGMIARQETQPLTGAQVRWLMDAEEMLRSMGLQFACPNCARLGLKDGVRANNDPTAQVLHVECGCRDRVFRLSHGRASA